MKKIFASFLIMSLLCLNSAVFAQNICEKEKVKGIEHLQVNKKAPNNTVVITDYRKIINKDNVLAVTYDARFYTKTAKAGDVVNFTIPQALYTTEGTMVLPQNTKIVAEVTNIQNPKWFNKNARANLMFKCIVLPDGRIFPIKAEPFTKDRALKEGAWMTTSKILVSTVSLGIVGGGAGVGFGFLATPAKVGVGIGAGIATGCGVGLLTALITKGLHYRTKAGEQIYIIMLQDASVAN